MTKFEINYRIRAIKSPVYGYSSRSTTRVFFCLYCSKSYLGQSDFWDKVHKHD